MKLEINKINICNKINKKVCVISDIHYYFNYNNKIFKEIIRNIKSEQPDYILIPGDIIDNTRIIDDLEIYTLYKFITCLSKINKVIISIGNHDISYNKNYIYPKKFINQLRKIENVKVLDNEIYEDGSIRFIGYTQDHKTVYNEKGHEIEIIKEINTLLKIDNRKYNILLSHNPLYLTKVYHFINNWNKLNLVISGHTHGGLMPSYIKGHCGIISPCKRWFIKDCRGLITRNNVNIYISNGIIKLSNEAGLFHLFNKLFKSSIDYLNI